MGLGAMNPGPAVVTDGRPMTVPYASLAKVNSPVFDNGRVGYMNQNVNLASQFNSMPVPGVLAT